MQVCEGFGTCVLLFVCDCGVNKTTLFRLSRLLLREEGYHASDSRVFVRLSRRPGYHTTSKGLSHPPELSRLLLITSGYHTRRQYVFLSGAPGLGRGGRLFVCTRPSPPTEPSRSLPISPGYHTRGWVHHEKRGIGGVNPQGIFCCFHDSCSAQRRLMEF